MGTCASKCYPCFHSHHPIPCSNCISTSTAGISQASPAVHPNPLPEEAAAASASPTTTITSSSLMASSTASLCASSGSSSSSSAASSSSYLWRRRTWPRELVLLPNASTSTITSNSMSSRAWDVVVLDPKSMSSDTDRCNPIISMDCFIFL